MANDFEINVGAQPEEKISPTTGQPRFNDVGYLESVFGGNVDYSKALIDQARKEGRTIQEAKELGYPTPEYIVQTEEEMTTILQQRYDSAVSNLPPRKENLYPQDESKVEFGEAYEANWMLGYGGQSIQHVGLMSEIGFVNKKAQYDDKGNLYDVFSDPAFSSIISKGYGPKFIEERVVNREYAFYLAEQMYRNANYYDKAARGGIAPMLLAGLTDLVNFAGFGLVKGPGMYIMSFLDKGFKGGIVKNMPWHVPFVGATAGKTFEKFITSGASVAVTTAALEPLRWKLDPFGTPLQSPGIIVGSFILGGAVHAVAIPSIQNFSKVAFGRKYREKHFDPHGGEEQLKQKYINDQINKHLDGEDWDSFQYRIGDDYVGIATTEYKPTNTFIHKDGGILITKPAPDKMIQQNPDWEYMPIEIVEVKSKGTQPAIEIIYDKVTVDVFYNKGWWKDMVPESMHKMINSADDLGKWFLKKEYYRSIKFPKKTNETALQHKERIDDLASRDLMARQIDDRTTDYGRIPLLSNIVKALNAYGDLEIGTRAFNNNIIVQNKIGSSFSRLSHDNALASHTQISGEIQSAHMMTRTVFQPLANRFTEDIMNDYNQYYLGLYNQDFTYRFPGARFNTQKQLNELDQTVVRTKDAVAQAIRTSKKYLIDDKANLVPEVPRDQKLRKKEFEERIAKLSMTEEHFSQITDQGVINAVNRTRKYWEPYKADIDRLKMLETPETRFDIQEKFNKSIEYKIKIIDDHNKGIKKLSKAGEDFIKTARNQQISERNSMGLKEPINVKEENRLIAENPKPKYELDKEWYPRQYLVDNIINHNLTYETRVLYPYFMAERLGIDAMNQNGTQMKWFELTPLITQKLNSLPNKDAIIAKVLKNVRATSTRIIDVNSIHSDIEGGFIGYQKEFMDKSNKNKISSLIGRRIRIASNNMVDISIIGKEGKTVDFISTALTSNITQYQKSVGVAISMVNYFGDKNGRLELHRMQDLIISEMIKAPKITSKMVNEANKVLSAWENAVNKQYQTHQPLDPRAVSTKLANIGKGILTPAKLSMVVGTSLVDYAQHGLVSGFAQHFKSINAGKQLKLLLSPEEKIIMKKDSQYLIGILEDFANLGQFNRYVVNDPIPIGIKTRLEEPSGNLIKDAGRSLLGKGESLLAKTEKGLESFNTFFFQSVFLSQFTRMHKEIARKHHTHTILDYLVKVGKNKFTGRDDPKYINRFLREFGFSKGDIEVAMRLYDAGLFGQRIVKEKSFALSLSKSYNKDTFAYHPKLHKWGLSNIPGADSFALKIRMAIANAVDKTILTPNANVDYNFTGGAVNLYSKKGMEIATSPFFKPGLTTVATGLGFVAGGPVGAIAAGAIAASTKVKKQNHHVSVANVFNKIYWMFLSWTKTATRTRLSNAVAGHEGSYVAGSFAIALLGLLGLWIKNPDVVEKMFEEGDYAEISIQSYLSGGGGAGVADIAAAMDVATDYNYGLRSTFGMPNPYDGGFNDGLNYSRNFGALTSTLIEGWNVYQNGTDDQQADWIAKSIIPYNNLRTPGVPPWFPSQAIGKNVYQPADKGGSAVGEFVRDKILMPIVD